MILPFSGSQRSCWGFKTNLLSNKTTPMYPRRAAFANTVQGARTSKGKLAGNENTLLALVYRNRCMRYMQTMLGLDFLKFMFQLVPFILYSDGVGHESLEVVGESISKSSRVQNSRDGDIH